MKKYYFTILIFSALIKADFEFKGMLKDMKNAAVNSSKEARVAVESKEARVSVESTEGIEVSFGVIGTPTGVEGIYTDEGSLGFECVNENEIILQIGSHIFKFDENEKYCNVIPEKYTSILTWKAAPLKLEAKSYDVSVVEEDIWSNDQYTGNPITFNQNEILSIERGGYIQKDIGSNYFIGFKGNTSKKPALAEGIDPMLAITQSDAGKVKTDHILVNKKLEPHLLKAYKKLAQKGISKELSTSLDEKLSQKLKNAPAELAYMNYVISGLKNIQRGLKENNKDALENYINQTKYLMFAWTLPFEILATKNIVDQSLFGNTADFYQNEKKVIYGNYSMFINSLVYLKVNATNDKALALKLLNKSISDKESASPIFYIPFNEFSNADLINMPLNDDWYSMIRIYKELQDGFYKSKKEVKKIIKILEVLPDTEIVRSELQNYMYDVDKLYRSLDRMARHTVFSVPISLYTDIYTDKFKEEKGLFNDDEDGIADIAVSFNEACANMQKYLADRKVMAKVLKLNKKIKKEFKDEHWKEVVTRAKLGQDWLNMLNKVEIRN